MNLTGQGFPHNFKPTRPLKRRLREVFRHFDLHALELLEKMLALDPSQRISAKDALDAEYFWVEPLPCDPNSLPKYEASHEFQTKKKRQQQRQQEETAKRQKLQHHQQHGRLPPIQQTGQSHGQMRPGPSGPPLHGSVPPVSAGGTNHHYSKSCGLSGGPSRYPRAAIPVVDITYPVVECRVEEDMAAVLTLLHLKEEVHLMVQAVCLGTQGVLTVVEGLLVMDLVALATLQPAPTVGLMLEEDLTLMAEVEISSMVGQSSD